ncbi:MAG: hypothetical protein ACI36W_03645 [Coriobacteriales bacterium]
MRQSWVSWTLVKDNAQRFWPLWLAFLGAWVLGLLLPLAVISPDFGMESARVFDECWPVEYVASLLGTAVASVIAVTLVFEYLYSPTAAQYYGSLPLKRGAVFASAFISGLLPLVVVELLVFAVLVVLVALMPQIGAGNCLTWLGLTLCFTFVSYSMASFCAQLTGSKAMTSWLFVLGNLLIVVLEAILQTMAETMMVGVSFMMSSLSTIWTSPIGGILYYVLHINNSLPLELGTQELLILAAYVLAAAVMLAAAVLLNKRRNLETAGNTIAYAGVRLVFKYVIGICAAVAVGFIALFCMMYSGSSALISNPQAALMTVFMILGGFAGVFFAELALNKSTRVLGSAWRGGLAVAVLCVLFTGGCVFDLLGIKGYVPAPSQVEKVEVMTSGNMGDAVVTDQQAIEELTAVHKELLELPEEYLHNSDAYSDSVRFSYELKDGSSVARFYEVVYRSDDGRTVIEQSQDVLDKLSAALSKPSVVMERFEPFMQADFSRIDAVLSAGWTEDQGYTTEVHVDYSKASGFWKALEKDIKQSGLGAVALGAYESEDVYPKNAAPLDINGYVDDGSGPSDYRSEYLLINSHNAPATCAWFEKNYQVKFE